MKERKENLSRTKRKFGKSILIIVIILIAAITGFEIIYNSVANEHIFLIKTVKNV